MATDWRGYRRLGLGGRRFRWSCAFHDPSERFSSGYGARGAAWPPDRLLVRPEDDPTRLLTVEWPACRAPVVTPRLVRACVEEARRRGWPEAQAALTLAGMGGSGSTVPAG